MSILDLLKGNKPTPEQAQATLEKLRDEQREAQAWLIQAESELADCLLAKTEGILDGAGLAKGRKAVADAKQALSDASMTIAGAEQRLSNANSEANEKELTLRRKRIAELCEQRIKQALKFQKLAVDMATAINQLQETAGEIYSTLPKEVCLTAALLNRGDLHSALKEQLSRAAAQPWSPGPFCEYELERRPDLAARVAAANEILKEV